jgi:hypothetical protein
MACQSFRGGAAVGEQHDLDSAKRVLPPEPHELLIPSSDKSALLWMYGREIAAFETPAFNKKVGEIITRATQTRRRSEESLRAA